MLTHYSVDILFEPSEPVDLEVQWTDDEDTPINFSNLTQWMYWVFRTSTLTHVARIGKGLTVYPTQGLIYLNLSSAITSKFVTGVNGQHALRIRGGIFYLQRSPDGQRIHDELLCKGGVVVE